MTVIDRLEHMIKVYTTNNDPEFGSIDQQRAAGIVSGLQMALEAIREDLERGIVG